MYVAEWSREDYEKLARFHYRDAKGLVATQKIFVLKRGGETAGVIVYKYPAITTFGRHKAFGRKLSVDEINRDLSLISRVIVHPKYRTIGLGVKLVKETLLLAGKPYVETVAVMAKYNPFFERAGMQKIKESTPSKHVLDAIEKLRSLGFNQILLSSEKTNMRALEKMSKKEIEEVKTVLKALCRQERGYGRRLLKTKSVFPKPEETRKVIDEAGLEKLAKTLRILSFLGQTKVYLIWRK